MKKLLPILFLFVLVSCDIFETRNAETPEDTRSNYTSPFRHEDLISNLINSFSDKNAENYKKSFAIAPELTTFTFSFTPSGQALSQYQIWEGWSVEDEFRYFTNLVNSTPAQFPITLSLSNELFSPSNDVFIYTADYFISVPQLNADPKTYSGSLKFYLTTNINNFWVIFKWEDIAESGSLSWSDLKGSAYN
jgi:hypothetical protein